LRWPLSRRERRRQLRVATTVRRRLGARVRLARESRRDRRHAYRADRPLVGAGAALLAATPRPDVAALVSVSAFSHPAAMMRRWLATRRISERPAIRCRPTSSASSVVIWNAASSPTASPALVVGSAGTTSSSPSRARDAACARRVPRSKSPGGTTPGAWSRPRRIISPITSSHACRFGSGCSRCRSDYVTS